MFFANAMNCPGPFRVMPAILLLAPGAWAHGPFDSSTRAIVTEATVEIVLTVGMEGGQTLLAGAPPEAFRVRTVGPAAELPSEFASRFFELSSGDKPLSADKVTVRTDGLEFALALNFPRPAGNALAVRAEFLKQLPSNLTSAFVMTDEVGNIFAGKVLSPRDAALMLTLPTVGTPAEIPVTAAPPNLEPGRATTLAAAGNPVRADKPSGIKPGNHRWLVLAGLLAMVPGGFWLKRRICSSQ